MIGRVVTCIDEIQCHRATSGSRPFKAWAAATISVDIGDHDNVDLAPFADIGQEVGHLLGSRLLKLQASSGDSVTVQAYGKAAIVGPDLDAELGAAILHPKLGKPLRALIGGGPAIMPSTLKVGGPGTSIDVPLHGVHDEWDFSLLDSVEAMVPNAPISKEIVVVVALACGGRYGRTFSKRSFDRVR